MKYLSANSSLLMLIVALLVLACSNDNSNNAASTPAPGATQTPAQTPVQLTPPTPVAGVDHYTCPNGHPGAASAGNCASCGAVLEHNQAYHNNQATTTPNITTTPQPQTTASPAQNAAGVYHYTCPNGHPGAASAGNCSVCGSALAHNQAYHSGGAGSTPTINAAPPPGGTFAPMLQDNQGTPAGVVQPQTQTITTASPAQNAAGVYHYTCPNGHPGAGAAGNCSTCGSALTHNQAYHN